MKFYRFDSKEQFQSVVGTSESEFTKDGVSFSVIGRIHAGTESLQWVEVAAPDGGFNLAEMMAPDYIDGWHVNASGPVAGWDEYLVTPAQPMRIFA